MHVVQDRLPQIQATFVLAICVWRVADAVYAETPEETLLYHDAGTGPCAHGSACSDGLWVSRKEYAAALAIRAAGFLLPTACGVPDREEVSEVQITLQFQNFSRMHPAV